ncbi:MAG: MMPL family transporter [Pseudonocardia sp.]|nr:MMPL family transporter [Pseudonocardia sp.]
MALRWPVLLAVAAITWAALSQLTGMAGEVSGKLSFLGTGSTAIEAQQRAVARFGLPLLSRTVVVQRDPEGLNPYTAARSVLHALEVDKQTLTGTRPPGQDDLLLALPLINSPLLIPGAAERNTTIVTYLFSDPSAGIFAQRRAADAYAAQVKPADGPAQVTGTIPVQIEKGAVVARNLPLVEAATLAAIAVIVGLAFRSILAPVVTLVTAGVAFLLADRTIGTLSDAVGLAAPAGLEPVIVALVLGITTDYSIFFLSGAQRRLREGASGRDAARGAVREYLPIVATAGFTVACSVAALVVAESGVFRALGPGLSVTVLVGLAVSVTAVPALLAILGRATFWPSRFGSLAAVVPAGDRPGRVAGAARAARSVEARLIRRLADRRVSATVVAVVVALMVAASLPLSGLRSSVAPVDVLPADNPLRAAAEAAAAGFAPGILSPTEVIVYEPGITARRDALTALGTALRGQPGVSLVLGPDSQPLPLDRDLGLFLAPDGGAARYLVVFDSDPLAATAIERLRGLQEAMPRLLARTGLGGVEVEYAGDTALSLALVEQAEADLGRVAIAVGLASLALLVLFLRSLVAPLYLLVSSVLAVGAALGLTTLVFQGLLGQDGLIFYVPFAAAVLLVALGSDYNIFSVGYVWEQARRLPLAEALAVAVPRSTRAINTAGVALAASFALVALVPLAPLRQLAFAMSVGVLIDAFLVRSLLVPALISLVGRASGWPGKRLTPPSP